jgi:REP element-mobilizing transposase RayT
MYEPNVVYEITVRTIQGRFLLRPSPEVNELIAGIIGRAQVWYPSVHVHLVVTLSNHVHWLISSPDPEQIPQFMSFVNGRISWEIGRVHDWPGSFWEAPAEPTPIVDNKSLVRKFRYLLEQGCKEGLVESPRDWPGLTCVPALTRGRPVRGYWFDRDAASKARRRGDDPGPYNFATPYEIKLSRLPCWRNLSDEQYRQVVTEIVEDIAAETRKKFPRESNPVLGAKAVMAMDPHHRPDELAKSPAPLCHASDRKKRRGYRVRYRRFERGFRFAAQQVKDGVRNVIFPVYSFPPRSPMVLPSG